MEKRTEELKMWKDMKLALESIPLNHRSRYHTDYLTEVAVRIHECQDLIEHLK